MGDNCDRHPRQTSGPFNANVQSVISEFTSLSLSSSQEIELCSRCHPSRMMMRSSLIANIGVNFVLVIIYVQFFGQQSIRRYLNKDIIVVTHEERTATVKPPGKINSR